MLIAAVGYRCCITSRREELIKIREGTALSVRSLVNPGPMTCGLAAIQTNKQMLAHDRRPGPLQKIRILVPQDFSLSYVAPVKSLQLAAGLSKSLLFCRPTAGYKSCIMLTNYAAGEETCRTMAKLKKTRWLLR
jgi:hypothetical protein